MNAFFKGSHEAEFAWFSGGMALPGSAMEANRAAALTVEACREGRPELILTVQAKAAVLLQALAPGVLATVVGLLNRLLPGAGKETGRHTGWESRGKTPDALIRRADEATTELNGLRGHTAI